MSASFNNFRGIHDGRCWYRRWCRHQQLMRDHETWRYWRERHKVKVTTLIDRSVKWAWWEVAFIVSLALAVIAAVSS